MSSKRTKTISHSFILTLAIGSLGNPFASLAQKNTAFSEREVTFNGAKGVRLEGTLTMPNSPGKHPAFLMIAGSGPTDRDGNSALGIKTDLFKQLSASLAKDGVATLRFDKRVAGSLRSSIPRDPVGLSDYCSWENFVEDAMAGYRFLRKEPGVDPNKTGLLGHSEGGMLALQGAAGMKSEKPVALILMGTPGRNIAVILREQIGGLLAAQKASPEQTKFFLDKQDSICADIKKSGKVPANVPAGLAALYPAYLGKFLQSELLFEPTKDAASFAGPVLLIQGEKDVQISAERDAPELAKALHTRRNDRHESFIVPNASHNLKHVSEKSDPGFGGDVDPAVFSKLRTWIKSNLKG